jgi:hypothetical protein
VAAYHCLADPSASGGGGYFVEVDCKQEFAIFSTNEQYGFGWELYE